MAPEVLPSLIIQALEPLLAVPQDGIVLPATVVGTAVFAALITIWLLRKRMSKHAQTLQAEIDRANEDCEQLRKQLKDAERRLEQKSRDVEHANEALQQFVYVASHDLRQPLHNIKSFADLLFRHYQDSFDERGEEFLRFMTQGANRAQDLVEDLLEFARVHSQGKPFEEVDIGEVVCDVLDELEKKISESNATLNRAEMPTVYADPAQVAQLFRKLLDNALKFRRPDVTPEIHVNSQRADNGYEFQISDNGIGIEEKYFEHIFQIFHRLHRPDAGYSGTGAGLAICQRIVQRHGGNIWVTSRKNEGTTFHFTIPDPE